ncbi:hypothetical protein CAP36_07145 [Chitinophagaceae bacterium IBVUCB2]|nr:hypothetical protein CAP36_07145 [Chitinophagaceae bacterium IBVUCB2]
MVFATNKFMKAILIISFSTLLLTACSKNGIPPSTASCIKKEILSNKDNPDWYTGTVEEYTFQNKTVYAFLPDGNIIADGSTTIKDEYCNTLCNIGGFGGPAINKCNGENFYEKAVLVRTIWKKKSRE